MVLQFKLDHATINNTPIIRVKGEIDIHTCPQLADALNKLHQMGHNFIILNLINVQYIDSTGLGAIARCAHQLSKQNGMIRVIAVKPQIETIFNVSGLSKKNIQLFKDEESALALVPLKQ